MSKEMKLVARLLSVKDGYKAWVFCAQVQRLFEKCPPTVAEIIECLKRANTAGKTPEQIARLIKEMRAKTTLRKRTKGKPRLGTGIPFGQDIYPSSPPLRHDSREFIDGFEKCPHGVPTTGICHICKGGTIDY